MAKVTVTDGCWNWKGAKTGSGYGQFWNGVKKIPAHWFLLLEKPPKGMEACHVCDNKLCVRPSHLFIGSRSDNMKDMVSKGRHNPKPGCDAMLRIRKPKIGESNHQSKLSESDVVLIKTIGKKRGLGVKLAKFYGVSETVISGIWKGNRWPHVVADKQQIEKSQFFLKTFVNWRDA